MYFIVCKLGFGFGEDFGGNGCKLKRIVLEGFIIFIIEVNRVYRKTVSFECIFIEFLLVNFMYIIGV